MDMDDSFQSYKQLDTGWRLCEDPSFHGCLENYPADGNVLFHPDNFNAWQKELNFLSPSSPGFAWVGSLFLYTMSVSE
jgi:hypothetical protein